MTLKSSVLRDALSHTLLQEEAIARGEVYDMPADIQALVDKIGEDELGIEKIPLNFSYTNWRGVFGERSVKPLKIWCGISPYHEGEQWFISAIDLKTGERRDFALNDFIGSNVNANTAVAK